jgi:ParB family chromosome partitioning protein
MMKTTTRTQGAAKAPNVFAAAGDVLQGVDALFTGEQGEFQVLLDDVEIIEQQRDEFEDDEQTLRDLGESLGKFQIQAIFLRTMPAGHPKPYRLVAGERRIRAAKLKGLTHLRAKARELSDDEAEDLQFAENIQRKNLTQIEEAKKIRRDLDSMGSVEAVLTRHNKSRAWLSKMLSLLDLPEQASRLVREKVSADVEVINSVKQIERRDPQAARELVDSLKATRGRGEARQKVEAARRRVKPAKRGAPAAAKDDEQLLAEVFTLAAGAGSADDARAIAASLTQEQSDAAGSLREQFDQGRRATKIGPLIFGGIRNGTLGPTGAGALRLAALVHGFDAGQKGRFQIADTLNVLRD